MTQSPLRRSAALALAGLALALLGACSTVDPATRLTRELLAMPKEEAYAKGDALVARRKYETGRQYLRFVAENYANDPIGKQAALRLADSYFDEKTPLGYLEAQARYKDFRNRYPSHPRSDYALYRLALCADRQAERPDRDQTNTRLAANSYRELMQVYPDSPYTAESRLRHNVMRGLLAEHEFRVAHFYLKRKAWLAAKGRYDVILSTFPEFPNMEQTLYEAGMAERRLGHDEDARLLWEKLAQDFPKSAWVRRLPRGAVTAPAPQPPTPAAASVPEPAAPAALPVAASRAPLVPVEAAPLAAAPVTAAPSESPPAASSPPSAPEIPIAAVSVPAAPSPASAPRPVSSRAHDFPVPGLKGKPVFSVHFSSYQLHDRAEEDARDLGRRYAQPGRVVRVEIPGKGVWFRVLLGAFATEREAQDFRSRVAASHPGLVYRLVPG